MPEVHNPFARAAAEAVAAATGAPPSDLTVQAPPRPEMGDFAIATFPVAKRLGEPPPAVAARVVAGFQPTPMLASVAAAGPFVNFRVDRAAAFRWVSEGNLVPSTLGAGKTVCIDYSSPNISKQLAYHHIRSTMIGHSLAEIHRALGYRVVGINHLGDWGTTHGMLIAAYQKWGAETIDIETLSAMYRRFRDEAKNDPALEAAGRAAFKALEDGDPEARRLWQWFRDVSWAEFSSIYDTLGIQFDEVRGESAYEPAMPGVIADLEQKGLTSISDGALVVVIPGDKVPALLKKGDGATLYTTRDLAAAQYRWNTYHFEKSLYVVDRGQAHHFKQLFKVLEMAGYEWAKKCEHVPFGLVRFGGKKTSSRGTADQVILLKEVFQEAADGIRPKITSEMSDEDKDRVASMVGIGAVVFANLASQRERDVDFDWEKVLSLQGDSGPYLQYSHARCASILRKAGEAVSADARWELLTHDAEWAVARRLLDYGDHVVRAAGACEPHVVAHFLLDLCADFSRWYTTGNDDAKLRVLCDDPDTRRARLALTASVKAALAHGLSLLGLRAPEIM